MRRRKFTSRIEPRSVGGGTKEPPRHPSGWVLDIAGWRLVLGSAKEPVDPMDPKTHMTIPYNPSWRSSSSRERCL